MSIEDQDIARDAVKKATDTAQLSGVPVRIALRRLGLPHDVYMLALRYMRLPDNPARRIFRLRHADALGWFEDIPLSQQVAA
jgi:hypothetical protein